MGTASLYTWVLVVASFCEMSNAFYNGGYPPCGFPRYDSCRETIETLKALLEITQALTPNITTTLCPACTTPPISEELIIKLVNALIYTATQNCGFNGKGCSGVPPNITGGTTNQGGNSGGNNSGGLIGGNNTLIGIGNGGGNPGLLNGGGNNIGGNNGGGLPPPLLPPVVSKPGGSTSNDTKPSGETGTTGGGDHGDVSTNTGIIGDGNKSGGLLGVNLEAVNNKLIGITN